MEKTVGDGKKEGKGMAKRCRQQDIGERVRWRADKVAAYRFQHFQCTAAHVLTRFLMIAFSHVEKQTM